MTRPQCRRDGRAAEGDGLLNRYTGSNPYPGFESPSLRFFARVFRKNFTGKGAAVWCRFTARTVLACLSLMLCASVALAQPQADSPYRVTYDNGVSIEVIAISITPTRNRPFWDPSGAKLLERPYEARQSGTLRGLTPGKQTYEVVIRISGVKEKPIYLTPAEGSDSKVLMTFIPYAGGKTADDFRAFLIAAPWDKELMDLDIGVAANDWQQVRSFKGPGLLGGGQQEVEVYNPDPYQVQRTPGLHYSVRVATAEEAMRVVAIDEAGTRHIS